MRLFRIVFGAVLFLTMAMAACAHATVSSPREALGHEMGEDYFLANYSQLVSYWKLLASQSDRIRLVEIGRTSEDRPQYMAIVSSSDNLKNLDRYRDTSARLAHAEGLSDDLARNLAHEGKAIVWVDGGLHAAEVECAQALIQEVYDLVSSDDPEAVRIRDNAVVLFAQDNPDGQELVADWYMRIQEPAKREADFSSLPRLYHPRIGHDNNRDFYMSEMKETTNINRVLFRQWYPQIVHNQHQRGPLGAVVFMPPFRDPFNYNYDPLVITELEELGATMHSRLIEENKPGSAMRGTATYDTWYNGSLRTVSYFHNAIGVLTEISGMPTPLQIPLIPKNQLPRSDLPYPVPPQTWHMKQSVDYSIAFNRALMSYAAGNRERLLFNIYIMGRNAIARGRRDNWTITASRIDALNLAAGKESTASSGADPQVAHPGGPEAVDPTLYARVLHDPAARDARGYVIPADQPDFPTAIRFLNALIKGGVTVQRTSRRFTVGTRSYPAGSFVVRTDQAYRPHILDMFEPQDHPHDNPSPGAPPTPPADSAGYTLAFQMGVKFDRLLDDFSGPFEPVGDLIAPPAGAVLGHGKAGYLISHQTNNSFILTSRLLKAGRPVYWLKSAVSAGRVSFAPGAIWAPASAQTDSIVREGARSLGLTAYALGKRPAAATLQLREPRIALVDLYGGLMPTGWTRWIFEQFEIPCTIVYPKRLDLGGLRKDFDVILLTDSAIPNERSGVAGGMFRGRFDIKEPAPETIPVQYRDWLGTITPDKTVPSIEAFLADGGTVIGIGSSAAGLVRHLKLPVEDALTDSAQGKSVSLPRTQFYVPGSLLTARVDPTQPLAYGMPDHVDLFFDSSPAFRASANATDVRSVAWFAGKHVLHSGWAFGQEHLDGAQAALEVPAGKGKVFLFGPEIAMRAQTQGAFKLLFNGVFYGSATSGR
jgi:hypothetical protein